MVYWDGRMAVQCIIHCGKLSLKVILHKAVMKSNGGIMGMVRWMYSVCAELSLNRILYKAVL